MNTAQTAAEAFERYNAALAEDRLVQSQWHCEVDGRHLACGLRALTGEKIGADEWRPVLKTAFLDVYAYADAYANAYAYADVYARKLAVKRLADGIVECLARVPSDLAGQEK